MFCSKMAVSLNVFASTANSGEGRLNLLFSTNHQPPLHRGPAKKTDSYTAVNRWVNPPPDLADVLHPAENLSLIVYSRSTPTIPM